VPPRAKSCHLTSTPRRLCDFASSAMPKVAAPRKVGSVSSAPANTTVNIKSFNRGRNKIGRTTASNIKTTVEPIAPEPTPPPLLFVLPDPVNPESESEEEVPLTTPKGPSRAVSVSLHVSRHWVLLNHQQKNLGDWLAHREEDLDDLAFLEGLGDDPPDCVFCQSPAQFRCGDCFGGDLVCKPCLMRSHSKLPLHVVEVRSIILL